MIVNSYADSLRAICLAPPELDVNQMLRVERGEEPVPLEWPQNWQYLLLIHKIADMIESHEIQIDQWIESAAKARTMFDEGRSYGNRENEAAKVQGVPPLS